MDKDQLVVMMSFIISLLISSVVGYLLLSEVEKSYYKKSSKSKKIKAVLYKKKHNLKQSIKNLVYNIYYKLISMKTKSTIEPTQEVLTQPEVIETIVEAKTTNKSKKRKHSKNKQTQEFTVDVAPVKYDTAEGVKEDSADITINIEVSKASSNQSWTSRQWSKFTKWLKEVTRK